MAWFYPRKRRWRVLLALAAALAVGWFAVPQLLVPKLRTKLQAMMATQLQAELRIDSLRYSPPYGVRARGVSLVANDPKHGQVEVLRIGLLDLKLAKLPLGDGPLVIENITIRDPEIHIVIADGRMVGRGHIVRERPEEKPAKDPVLGVAVPGQSPPSKAVPAPPGATQPAATAAAELPPDTKLSDMFLLRHFGLSGGRVIIENRDRPDTEPMVWQGLDAQLQTGPRSKSTYDFSFTTDPTGVLDLRAEGAFDLDALWVDVTKLKLAVSAHEEDRGSLPAAIQQMLKPYGLRGRLTVDGSAWMPLRQIRSSRFDATVDLSEGSAVLPERGGMRIDSVAARISLSRPAAPAGSKSAAAVMPMDVMLHRLAIDSGHARFEATGGRGVIDRTAGTWKLRALQADLVLDPVAAAKPGRPPSLFEAAGTTGRASALISGGGRLGPPFADGGFDVPDLSLQGRLEGLTLRVPKFEAPLREVTGALTKVAGSAAVTITDASLAYGNDRAKVTRARLLLPAELRRLKESVRVEEITGTAEFSPERGVAYPGGFGKVIATLRPGGAFAIGGGSWYAMSWYDLDPAAVKAGETWRRRRHDYFFSVSTDDGRLGLLGGRFPLVDVQGDATISPLSVRTEDLKANVYGGSLIGTFQMEPKKPRGFQGGVALRDVQLRKLGEAFGLPPEQCERIAGTAFLNATYGGEMSPPDRPWSDTLRGQGQFEVFGGQFWTLPVFKHIADSTKQSGNLTVGEAAGRFEIKEGGVELRQAAVQSPALGLMGSGRIGFDKSLDLRVIAAPLGDWRDRIKRGGVPILSNVAGEVFGALQKVLNAATSTLLYEFRVEGTTGEPKVDAVPVPALTEPAALLLGQMAGEGADRKWSDTAKGKQ